MKGNNGNPGINQLAGVLSQRMKSENESPLVLDFGEIQANGSLVTNTFTKRRIFDLQAAYSWCSGRRICGNKTGWQSCASGDRRGGRAFPHGCSPGEDEERRRR